MPRRFIKRFLPDHHKVREHRALRFLGERLHDPNLWHLTRHSVAGAVALGVFTAFLPVPGQFVIAAVGALAFRVNLPLALVTIFISNPVTMPPLYYATYRLGAWLLGIPAQPLNWEWSVSWLLGEMLSVWKPLFLGSVLAGGIAALLAATAVRVTWRVFVLIKLRRRARRQEAR